jgi:hypothetical protein
VRLDSSILRHLCSISFVGIMDVLRIFVLDLDPSNAGFDLQFKDFNWNHSFVIELGCDSIPNNLVGWRLQVFGQSIS